MGVDDREHRRALLARVAHGHQRVHRLAGLGDRDHQGLAVHDGVAVAELVRELDLDRDPAPVLDRVLGDLPGVGGRPARDDDDLVDLAQHGLVDPDLVEDEAAGGVRAAQQGVGDGVRLVVDLLVHEGRGSRPSRRPRRPSRRCSGVGATGLPSKSTTSTDDGVRVTTWSWPSSSASRVCAMNAATSEPRKFSPSPSPTTSGESCRVPTTVSGASACTASSVNVPCSRRATVRIAVARSLAVVRARQQVRDHLGVGVAEQRTPASTSSARSWTKFSMMPLWITATCRSADRCGWALRSVGAPWVAHRVCPIAAVAAGSGSRLELGGEVGQLAGLLGAGQAARR